MESDRTSPRAVKGGLSEFRPSPFTPAIHAEKRDGGSVSRRPRKRLDQEVVSVVVIVVFFRGHLDIVIVVTRFELAEDVEEAFAIQGINVRTARDLLDAPVVLVTAVLVLEL